MQGFRLVRRTLLAALLLFGPLSATADAQMGMTVIVGGPGGGYFHTRCPDDSYLVGMNWTGGKDVVTVGPVCQPFSRMGHTDGPPAGLETKGGTPNSEGVGSARCPSDMAVQRITVEISNVNLVHGFTFTCRNPNKHDYRDSNRGGPNAGAANHSEYADCGGGALAIGVIGREGAMIDALGLRCLVIAAPAPPVAPQKPIKSVRPRPSPAPSAPAPAPPQATATDDVDMYSEPNGDSTKLGVWTKGSRATPLGRQDGWCKLQGIGNGQDAWVWGEFVSGC